MKALIVVDMQNDFIDGALGTPEAVAIVDPVRARLDRARGDGELVIFTRDTHEADYLSTQEGRRLPVEHCICGTHGWEITSALDVKDDRIVDKPSFGSLELPEIVAAIDGLEAVELVGLCTDICVISNALLLKARLPEVVVQVNASCCAGVTPQSHANALEAMKMCQIDVI